MEKRLFWKAIGTGALASALLFPANISAQATGASSAVNIIGTVDGISYDGDQSFISG